MTDQESEWEVLENNMIHCARTREKFFFGTPVATDSRSVDKVYSTEARTAEIFEDVVKGLVGKAVQGFNATVLAYGQTASGKTFTVRGTEGSPGLIPLSITEIFKETAKVKDRNFRIKVSFIELYNETINDLLKEGNDSLEIGEDRRGVGTFIKGLTCSEVTSLPEAMRFLQDGDRRKKVAETSMNTQSSRSHTIFQLKIESRPSNALPGTSTQVSQLNLVDLAGSEGVSKTHAEGIRLKEGSTINTSLLALSMVIQRLSANENAGKHISYRNSKLTRILQPALSGNSKTAIICTISQQSENFQETINTLRFGVNAKKIKNSAKVNTVIPDLRTRYDLAVKEIKHLKEEVMILKDDNIQLRQQLLEATAKALQQSAAASPVASPGTMEKFSGMLDEFRRNSEATKEEMRTMKAELDLRGKAIDDRQKRLDIAAREIARLKEFVANAGLDYASIPGVEEELKYTVMAAPEEPSDQDLSIVEEDGLRLLGLTNSMTKSRRTSYSASKAEFATMQRVLQRRATTRLEGLPEEPGEGGERPEFAGRGYEERISELEESRNSLAEMVRSYERANDKLKGESDRLGLKNAENEAAIKGLIPENARLKVECSIAKNLYDSLMQEHSKLVEKQQRTELQLSRSALDLRDLTAARDKGEAEIRALRAELKSLSEEMAGLKAENSAQALKIHAFGLHKCPLKKDLMDREGQLQRMREALKVQEETNKQLGNKLDAAKRELKDHKNQAEKERSISEGLEAKLKTADKRIKELAAKLESAVVASAEKGSVKRKHFKLKDDSRKSCYEGKASKRAKDARAACELDISSAQIVTLMRKSEIAAKHQPFRELGPFYRAEEKENLVELQNQQPFFIGGKLDANGK